MEGDMKALIIAAAVAVACTGFASAKEVNKDTTKAPVVASKTMTDTDMDKVTAGSYDVLTWGNGQVFDSRVNYNGASNGFHGNNYHAACTTYSC
jgi:hypothetical protein